MQPLAVKKHTITYNYWLYLLTCLAIMGVIIRFVGRDPGTQWDFGDIIFRLGRMFFFSNLAWFIGKKYRLHYSLICGLSVLTMAFTSVIWEICAMLFFHFSFGFDLIVIGVGMSLFATLLFGGAIFIVSYPVQYLFFKLKQNFRKLK